MRKTDISHHTHIRVKRDGKVPRGMRVTRRSRDRHTRDGERDGRANGIWTKLQGDSAGQEEEAISDASIDDGQWTAFVVQQDAGSSREGFFSRKSGIDERRSGGRLSSCLPSARKGCASASPLKDRGYRGSFETVGAGEQVSKQGCGSLLASWQAGYSSWLAGIRPDSSERRRNGGKEKRKREKKKKKEQEEREISGMAIG